MMKLFSYFFLLPSIAFSQNENTMHQTYTYLALGDSYTIGESVPLQKSFPYQTVQLLRKEGHNFLAPEIIAKTGWTTDELQQAMQQYTFLAKYDFVTLLIGVNNQYRGRDVSAYKAELEELLKKAIAFANNKPAHVVIVSIPDYSVTPFGQSKEPDKISKEIDVFNSVSKALSIQYKVQYIDITTGSKEAKNDSELIAEDGLHPSAKAYKKWAEKLAAVVAQQLK